MYNQYLSQLGQVPNMYNPYSQRTEVVHVNGEEGAKAYPMAPNSSIILLDENNPIIYFKQTDGKSV